MTAKSTIKTIASYALILALGLAGGYGATFVPGLFKKSYVEGDYAAYFPNPKIKVVLYSTAWCGYCAKTREHFKANNIDFFELDIEKSELARKQHQALGGGGVPVLLIGNRKIIGFNAPAIDEAVKNLGG